MPQKECVYMKFKFKKKSSDAVSEKEIIKNTENNEIIEQNDRTLPRFFIFRMLERKPVLTICILALIIDLLIEILSRHSVADGIVYMITNPVVFVYNSMIIALTLSISQLFKRKTFVLTLISVLWLALGITNFYLLGLRTTPLSATDFFLIRSVYLIIAVYLTPVQVIMIVAALILAIVFIVFIFMKLPKQNVRFKSSIIFILSMVLIVSLSTVGLLKVNAIADRFGNMVSAYDDYGFVYCFSMSVLDSGVSKPDDYSFEKVYQVIEENDIEEKAEITPNIVVLQMESFVDCEYFTDYTYSENPNPYFQKLKEEYSSGFLKVPSVGAGTANVEFETISGMSLYHFGAGEYPYKSILRKTTCESYPFILKELGYNTQAMHNHNATFYDRNLVYPMLGFDRFISLEYMYDVEKTPLEWSKDYVLESEIMKALKSTEGHDFLYTISVQTHGKYPTEPIEETTIDVEGLPTEEATVGFEYYIQQIKENDELLEKIVNNIQSFEEPTVLVIFGDHLPNFPIEPQSYATNDIYLSEYVILTNFEKLDIVDIDVIDKDITSYQLISEALSRVGIHNGIINKIHQNRENNENYNEDLELIEYDTLYGEKFSYGSEDRFFPTELQMGYGEIEVTGVTLDKENGIAYINGNGFNKYSYVFVNNKQIETSYIDYHTLSVNAEDIFEGASLSIGQIGEDKNLIDRTDAYQWKG